MTLLIAQGAGLASGAVWLILLFVALAGGLGGIVNSLLTDNGFALPKLDAGILRPGVVGNVILGAFGAAVTWGLYGPLKDAVIFGVHPENEVGASLTITALVGAALAGAGGARVITNEIDKRFLRNAAADAAAKDAKPELAKTMATATPADAAEAARSA